MKTYRTGFMLALVGNIVLIAVMAGFWWHFRTGRTNATESPKPESRTLDTSANPRAVTPAPAETPLVPVQLSPQRLQSIGVKTSEVGHKIVADEIRATGNVAVDETRLAYVQTRFSGYIQKVFADAT